MLVDCWITFLLEEPLAEVLLIARLGPAVVIDVEDFLLLSLFLRRRGLSSLLALCRLGLLCHCWFFQMKSLIVALSIFSAKHSKIPDRSNVLFDPIEILTDQILIILTVITDDNITEIALTHIVCNILEGEFIEIEESEIMTNCQVLEKKGVIILHEIDSWTQDITQ